MRIVSVRGALTTVNAFPCKYSKKLLGHYLNILQSELGRWVDVFNLCNDLGREGARSDNDYRRF